MKRSLATLTCIATLCLATAAEAQFDWSAFAPVAGKPEQPHPAVVRVNVPNRDGTSLGSGALVYVNERYGLVVTNWHVVHEATGPIRVDFPDGFRTGAQILAMDRDWDLAALAVWRPQAAPLPIATARPQLGESLMIAGYGSGSYRSRSGKLTRFLSPGPNFPAEILDVSAPARSGDSGGPILNSRGELAGVLFGTASGFTSGSECGRVRYFLNSVAGRLEATPGQLPLAAVAGTTRRLPAENPAANRAAVASIASPTASAASNQRTNLQPAPVPVAPPPPVASPFSEASTPLAASVPVAPAEGPADASTSANTTVAGNLLTSLMGGSPLDQAKSVMAIVGVFAVVLQFVRLTRAQAA